MDKLRVTVLRNTLGDCTNKGLSSRHDSFVLVSGDIPANFVPDEKFQYLKLVKRNICGKVYLHAEPLTPPAGIGWMAGGNFIYSSDSRFPGDYPISIHDRQETPQ